MALCFGEFELDRERRQLLRDGVPVPLEPKAYELLDLLLERRPRVLTRSQIRDAVWPGVAVSESTVSQAVNNIRHALDDDARRPRFIRTAHGYGYAFSGEASEAPEVRTSAQRGSASPGAPEGGTVDRSGFRPTAAFGVRATAISLLMVGLGAAVSRWWPASEARLTGAAGRVDDEGGVPRRVLVTSLPGAERQPALSPFGDRVAFVRRDQEGNDHLYVKLLASQGALKLTRDPGSDCCPVWSPDAQWIAFVRSTPKGAGIYQVPALGGPGRLILEATPWFGSGLSWSPDGERLVYSASEEPGAAPALWLYSLATRDRKPLTRPPADSLGDAFPSFSHDGRQVAFVRLKRGRDLLQVGSLHWVPAAGGEPRLLADRESFIGGLAWSTRGNAVLFWSREGSQLELLSAAFPSGEVRSLGETLPFSGEVQALQEPSRSYRLSSVGQTNQLAFAEARFAINLWSLDLTGRSPSWKAFMSTRNDSAPSYSPDGSRVAFNSDRRLRGNAEVLVCDARGEECEPLTAETGHSGTPDWSPDGRWIAFDSRPDGHADVMVADASTGRTVRLTMDPAQDVVPSWSIDSRWVYFTSDRSGDWQIWKTPLEGGDAIRMTREGGFSAEESADGEWLYHARLHEPGIWRIPTTGVGRAERVPPTPKCWGHWAIAGEWLYYVETTRPRPLLLRWQPDTLPEPLQELPRALSCGERCLAVSPDGLTALVALTDVEESDVIVMDEPY